MERTTVSLCLIARDEEATIGMAIKSVLALVDEVIVVDTGSQDNTRIIAEGYGARVVEVGWEDDFSVARNVALAEASCDWILVLDADEFLQPVRPVEFQRLLQEPGVAGYRVSLVSPRNDRVVQTFNLVRLFRNSPDIRYCYPIHEQILPSLEAWAVRESLSVRDSDLTIMHEGYMPEHRARKRERNTRILRKALEIHPDEPYFPYQLACEGLSLLDDEILPVAGLSTALGHLNASWRKVRLQAPQHQRTLPWLPDLGAKLSASLLAIDQIEEARTVIYQVRELLPEHPLVLLGRAAADTRYLQQNAKNLPPETTTDLLHQVRQDLILLQQAPTDDQGVALDQRLADLYPLRYLGELALLEGHVSEAVGLFEQALSQDPRYSFAWLGMAECSRFAGDRKRALKLYLRTVTENEWNHRAWLRGCGLMREMGFHDNAASWWRKVVTQFPEHPMVSLARGEAGAVEDSLAQPK